MILEALGSSSGKVVAITAVALISSIALVWFRSSKVKFYFIYYENGNYSY
jgi:hypothetical protein